MIPRVALALFLAGIFAACSSPGAPAASGAATATAQAATSIIVATPSAAPTASPIARIESTFTIGDGQKLYLRCIGSGTPTILLEAGDGDSGTNGWRLVDGKLSAHTRTCVYDRAGLGRSSAATGCRQLVDILDDLDALLAAAAIQGPYLLVGASGGGFLVAGFAMRHPEVVEGMVFVETPKALTAELYPEVLPEIACDGPGNVERRDYLAVEHAAWDNRKEIGDFPLTVLSNDWGGGATRDDVTNVASQRGWFDLTSGLTRQVVVTSGHDIASDDPQLVIDEVLTVLALARG